MEVEIDLCINITVIHVFGKLFRVVWLYFIWLVPFDHGPVKIGKNM